MDRLYHRRLIDRQTRRIRWNTGVPEHTARVIADLAFGSACR